MFFPSPKPELISREEAEARILAHRYEGESSIDGTSTLMKRFKTPYSSVGYISQYLTYVGKLLPNVLENKRGTAQFLAFVDDEMFSKSLPILITVEPRSSAILRIELTDHRSANEWSNHYQALLENNVAPRLLVSDAGAGLTAAHANTLPETPWQLDSFHAIAHRLGDWVRRLEKTAYTAIETVDKRIKTLASAKTDSVIDKRLNRCFEADEVARQAIELYDTIAIFINILFSNYMCLIPKAILVVVMKSKKICCWLLN